MSRHLASPDIAVEASSVAMSERQAGCTEMRRAMRQDGVKALHSKAFRDQSRARGLIEAIHRFSADRTLNLMEVCGTHTMGIGRYGLRTAMPTGINLLSGPGCPVCVTANRDIDRAVAIARIDQVILTTFGDMMRVPGSSSSLGAEKALGRDVRVVYSPLDALDLAISHPNRPVVFAAVGFETTAPAIAATILEARERHVDNFFILSMHKVTPPALRSIACDPSLRIDGFILPGHVSTITGVQAYRFLADEYGIPGVITGFEPVDILEGITMLIRMAISGESDIRNAYRRGVASDGNLTARGLVDKVFKPCTTTWRGLGELPASGLCLRNEFLPFDAGKRFDITVEPTREPAGCRCGDILRGRIDPESCPLYKTICTPEHPVGPCMVSSEGSCAARIRYC